MSACCCPARRTNSKSCSAWRTIPGLRSDSTSNRRTTRSCRLFGVRGCQLAGPRVIHWLEERLTLPKDMLIVPEVVIKDRNVHPARVLRPAFHRVRTAFGFVRSLNYDDQGQWKER